MTPDAIHATLLRAFSVLTAEQRENFRWHLEHETPVLCGDGAGRYVDGSGGG